MARVRFQMLFGPPSQPNRSRIVDDGDAEPGADASVDARFSWRLIGANNHVLGRSAGNYTSYPRTRHAVRLLQRNVDRLVSASIVNPSTGRWGWRLDLDNRAVAISGRWYERDQDSREGMDRFLQLLTDAELVDGVTYDRRRSGS